VLRNLFLTMLLAGLWHGANWTYPLWGAYHGLLLVLYRVTPPLHAIETAERGWRKPVGIALMFALTLVGWAIFRCGSLAQLADWFVAFTRWGGTGTAGAWKPAIGEVLRTAGTGGLVEAFRPAMWLLIHAVPLVALQFLTRRAEDEVELDGWPWLARSFVYGLMFLAVASSTSGDVEFIYFQF
jgi:hypothetical protein